MKLYIFLILLFTTYVVGEYLRPIPFYNSMNQDTSYQWVNGSNQSRAMKRYLTLPDPNPADLQDNLFMDGFNRPVNIEFAPDGRIFVAEKGGVVKIIGADGVLQPESWLDITPKVHDAADRGMLGMALDPDFANNKWVYILYVVNPQEGVPNISPDVASYGIIVRYSDNNGKADLASMQLLLGDKPTDGFPACDSSHLVGDLAFGLDGTLLASGGDGAHWEWVDDGTNKIPEDLTCDQMFPDTDIGAMRAQSFDSLGGKIVRINKDNGNGIGPENGLVPNPFYDAANPKSIRSKIWTYGNRNQWRLHVRPDSNAGGPGTIYVSDVGFYTWEEFNVVRQGGGNYGWPCVVGDAIVEPDYNNMQLYPITATACQPILQQNLVSSIIYYNHYSPDWAGFIGNAASGTVVYTGNLYPDRYKGNTQDRAVFCADFGQQWIKVFWVDENDNFKADKGIQTFKDGAGLVTRLKAEPQTGDIFYLLLTGQIRRIQAANVEIPNTPPRPYVAAYPPAGNVGLKSPLTVQFSSDGTYDQENDAFWVHWDFGDGGYSNEANPVHNFTTSGSFTVRLTVIDSNMNTAFKEMTYTTSNTPPTVKITSPANNHIFPTVMGQERTAFKATVTDPDSPGASLIYRWEFRVIHNNHWHSDEFVTNEREFDFDLATGVSNLERNMLEVYLVVTDDKGNQGQDMIRITPQGMVNGNPDAKLKGTPIEGNAMVTVALDASESTDPDQDMLHTLWDFGDGTTQDTYATKKTYHSYTKPGTYKITVAVTDVFAVTSVSEPVTITVGGDSLKFNLMGYWSMDDINNGDVTDCSNNKKTGKTQKNVTNDENGHSRSAAGFSGGSEIIIDGALGNLAGTMSLSVYVKMTPNDNNFYPTIMTNKDKEWEGPMGFLLQFIGDNNLNAIRFYGSGPDFCQSTPGHNINDGKWHHIGVSVNDKNMCSIIIDGVIANGDVTVSPVVASTLPLRIANDVEGNALTGSIDEVKVWKGFMSSYQIIEYAGQLNSCIPLPVVTTGTTGTTGQVTSTSSTGTSSGQTNTQGSTSGQTTAGTTVGTSGNTNTQITTTTSSNDRTPQGKKSDGSRMTIAFVLSTFLLLLIL